MTSHRTAAGIAALKAHGGSYGAKRKLSRAQHKRVHEMHKAGKSKAEIGRTLGISAVSAANYIKRPLPKPGKPKR